MFKKIFNYFSKWETLSLVLLPIGIGLLPLFAFFSLGSLGYRGTSIGGFLLSLTTLCWGFMGVPMIIRKQVPWLITIRGWPAVLEGIILTLIGWGLTIGMWVSLLSAR